MYVNLNCRILDSSHANSNAMNEGITPLDNVHQLFASKEAIKFPVPVSDAWTEKVHFTYNF